MITKILRNFSRKGIVKTQTKKDCYEAVQYFQKRRIYEIQNNFRIEENPQFVPQYKRIEMYGNTSVILPNGSDKRTTNLTMAVLEEIKPKVLILGGMNSHELLEKQMGEEYFSQNKPEYNLKSSDIMAKEDLTVFLQQKLINQKDFFFYEQEKLILRILSTEKFLLCENELSAAKLYCDAPGTLVFYSKPEINIILEDLALRLDLNYLKKIFFDVVAQTQKEIRENPQDFPQFEGRKISERFKKILKQMYGEVLFEKYITYNASLMKKVIKIFKQCALITDGDLIEKISKELQQESLPDYDQIFRQRDEEVQQKRFDKNKKKLQRLFRGDEDVPQMLENLKTQHEKYNYSQQESQFHQQLDQVSGEEILEKYAILNILLENSTRVYLLNGVNPFKESFFEKKFQGLEVDQIRDQFENKLENYIKEIHELQNEVIYQMGLGVFQSSGRQKLISGKESIIQSVQKIKNFDYQILIGEKTKQKRFELIQNLLVNKAYQIILRRQEIEKIDQKGILNKFNSFLEGNIDEETVHTYHKLILEANYELGGIVKMPKKIFKRYLPYVFGVFKQQQIKDVQEKLKVMDAAIFEQFRNQLETQHQIKIQNQSTAYQISPNVYLINENGDQNQDNIPTNIDEILQMTPYELEQEGIEFIDHNNYKVNQDGKVVDGNKYQLAGRSNYEFENELQEIIEEENKKTKKNKNRN